MSDNIRCSSCPEFTTCERWEAIECGWRQMIGGNYLCPKCSAKPVKMANTCGDCEHRKSPSVYDGECTAPVPPWASFHGVMMVAEDSNYAEECRCFKRKAKP